jgi:glucose-6-phosphate isomerase
MEPAVRCLGDLRAVLAGVDPRPDDHPCYYLYRDVRTTADEAVFAEYGLRYDVTVTLPGRSGDELMKTAGHYHDYVPGTAHTYVEVYEVLSGHAIFLLQRVRDPHAGLSEVAVAEVLLIDAAAGDVMLIPSHMGHVTINAGDEPLVVADLVSRDAGHRYGAFREARGAAYYVLDPGTPPETRANLAYGRLPPPRWYRSPAEAGLGLTGPIYQAFCRDPDRFAFLTDPTLVPLAVTGSAPRGAPNR